MPVRTRIQTIDKDIQPLLSDVLTGPARSQALAEFAAMAIEEAKETNRLALGRVPPYRTFVDGGEGRPLASVSPNGVIVTEFEIISDALQWIGDQLEKHSPVKTGRYQRSHTLLADGTEIALGAEIPSADEYVFINSQPYARKIERGLSSQAPDGVYQAVATLARQRFGSNIARITFSYRTLISGQLVGGRTGNRSDQRNPAIIVKVRS